MDEAEIRNPFISDKLARISEHAVELLGPPDRMMYPSKSMRKPTTVFNANVFNDRADKIWYGDLEVERDHKALIELSNRVGPVYILWEMDGRFLEKMPTIGYVRAEAIVTVDKGNIVYSPDFQRYVDFVRKRPMEKEKQAGKKGGRKGEKE